MTRSRNRYLIVWEGDDDIAPLGDGQYEIFGQTVDAATGAEVGANDFRLSDMGPNGDPNSMRPPCRRLQSHQPEIPRRLDGG